MDAFLHRNPQQAEFWDERFSRNFTPWHQTRLAPELATFLQQQTKPLESLIPGCGHAEEVLQFIRAGWPVRAFDFSALALQQAQQRVQQAGLTATARLELFQADFFQYQADSALEFIFERAFFCALPVHTRPAIVQKWSELLLRGGLLAGYFYLDMAPDAGSEKPRGPPFICANNDWLDLMQNDFELLEQMPVRDSLAVFAGHEYWQVWRKK